MSGNQPNMFQGGLPNRIVIGMVDADAFNGTYTKKPFNFKNYDITTMGLTVNGENLPGKPLQLKFVADSNYISAFQTLYKNGVYGRFTVRSFTSRNKKET
jgi:hypothetical protein